MTLPEAVARLESLANLCGTTVMINEMDRFALRWLMCYGEDVIRESGEMFAKQHIHTITDSRGTVSIPKPNVERVD